MTAAATNPMLGRPEGPAPEVAISLDIIRRGAMVAPLLVIGSYLIWGTDGVWSSSYAIALVLANYGLSAGIIAVACRISYAALLAGVLFGYIFRLALIFVAVYIFRDTHWISMPALGTSIIITHLGLLVWELKYVALSLAYPGLKPQES